MNKFSLVKGSRSQAGQESFVLSILGMKKNGIYVEIGGYDGLELSNTYLLESEFGWRGVAIELDKKRTRNYNKKRKNRCLNVNALEFNYSKYFKELNYPKQMDYLQLDIEPAPNTLLALKKIPLNEYRFSTITFEHDIYGDQINKEVKAEAFQILSSLGYVRVVEDVRNGGYAFEDWYVDSTIINVENLNLESGKEWTYYFSEGDL